MDLYQILLQSIQTLLRAAEDQLTDGRAEWQINITIITKSHPASMAKGSQREYGDDRIAIKNIIRCQILHVQYKMH